MTPSCPKCGHSSFCMREVAIKDARYRHNAICCASCGAIVGMEEYLSIMHLLQQIAEKLGIRN